MFTSSARRFLPRPKPCPAEGAEAEEDVPAATAPEEPEARAAASSGSGGEPKPSAAFSKAVCVRDCRDWRGAAWAQHIVGSGSDAQKVVAAGLASGGVPQLQQHRLPLLRSAGVLPRALADHDC
jgi:hypothetical protein